MSPVLTVLQINTQKLIRNAARRQYHTNNCALEIVFKHCTLLFENALNWSHGQTSISFFVAPCILNQFWVLQQFLNCTVLLYCLEILPLRSVHTERGNLGLSNSFLLVDYGNFAETLILRVKKCFAQIYPLEIQISHSVLDKWGIYLSFTDDLWMFLNLVFVFFKFFNFYSLIYNEW